MPPAKLPKREQYPGCPAQLAAENRTDTRGRRQPWASLQDLLLGTSHVCALASSLGHCSLEAFPMLGIRLAVEARWSGQHPICIYSPRFQQGPALQLCLWLQHTCFLFTPSGEILIFCGDGRGTATCLRSREGDLGIQSTHEMLYS